LIREKLIREKLIREKLIRKKCVDTEEVMHDNDILRMRYWNGVKLDQVSLRRLSVLSTLSGVCH
jgi:hypothetical protein